MEHCDLTAGGDYFVKFHTSGKSVFEGHVNARWTGKHHRGDPDAVEAAGIALQEEAARQEREKQAALRARRDVRRASRTWRDHLRSWLIRTLNRIL